MILIATLGWGLVYRRRLQLRIRQLQELIQVFALLKGELEYQCQILPDAFIACGTQVGGTCGQWMEATGQRLNQMQGENFQSIWAEELAILEKQTALSPADIEEVRRLGNQLSYPDIHTQLGVLERYRKGLEEKERILVGELPGKMRTGTMLGVLGGVFLAILLV